MKIVNPILLNDAATQSREDKGGEFTGEFTKKLMQKLGIKWNLSIAERPQSHGTERTMGRALEAVRILMAQEQGLICVNVRIIGHREFCTQEGYDG